MAKGVRSGVQSKNVKILQRRKITFCGCNSAQQPNTLTGMTSLKTYKLL